MARVFKQRYTKPTPDGGRVTKISRKWYVEYRDGQGVRRRVPGYTDKSATQQLAAQLERRAAQEQSGLVDRYGDHRKRPLSEHLADWARALLAKGNTPYHATVVTTRSRKILEGCRFTFWPDLSASKVQTFVGELRTRGLSDRTCNFYLQAVQQFCRWCVRDGRAPDSPLAHLQGGYVCSNHCHDRRALSHDELRRLLDTTRNAPMRFRMTGLERSRLYQLAVETGPTGVRAAVPDVGILRAGWQSCYRYGRRRILQAST